MPENSSPDLTMLKEDEEISFPPPTRNIPSEVKDFVNRGHEKWKQKPGVWRITPALGTEKDARRIASLAREFAKTTGRTFRTKAHTDKTRLVYKVTDAFQPSPNGASPGGSPQPKETGEKSAGKPESSSKPPSSAAKGGK